MDSSAPAKGGAQRLAMARALAGVTRRRDPALRPLEAALRAATAGRSPDEEAEWIERIEERRRELNGVGEARPPAVIGRFLMRLVREHAPRSCIEVGTGLGLSGAYQAAALELNGAGRLITVRIDEVQAGSARAAFAELGLERVEVRVGERGPALESALAEAAPVDLAFVDTNAQEEPTLACFEAIAPRAAEGGVIVVDGVGFSTPAMARAWNAISADPRVSTAVPAGRVGVVIVATG